MTQCFIRLLEAFLLWKIYDDIPDEIVEKAVIVSYRIRLASIPAIESHPFTFLSYNKLSFGTVIYCNDHDSASESD
jgi:hypothetical protein